LPEGSFIKKILKHINYKIAVVAQYVSIMNAFYFNLPTITERSYQNTFIEKINLAAQNFLFVFSTFSVCFSLFMLDKVINKKSKK
jgi:hypothetical protein